MDTLVLFTLALLLSVLVHEFGHYFVFHFFGGNVEEFSLGFGPTLIKRKVGQTTFLLRLLPLGGYVEPNGRDFKRFSYMRKIKFFSAGILMNLVLYFVSFGFASMSNAKSFIHGLVVAMDGLIYIISHISELFSSLQIDLMFSSHGSVEQQMIMVQELGNNVDFWLMLAIINITLIFINILPIPVLDGGKIVVTTVEHFLLKVGVAREKIDKVINPLYFISWILLMAFIFLQLLWANTFQFIENMNVLKETYGMTSLEIILWTSLIIVFFINVYIFVSNRIAKISGT